MLLVPLADFNTAAATSAAYGAGVALPAGAMTINKSGTTYYLSGNTWFQPSYGANGVFYIVVPAGSPCCAHIGSRV